MTNEYGFPPVATCLRLELEALEQSMFHTVTDVLSVSTAEGIQWYHALDDEAQGSAIVAQRIELHGERIARILNLHGAMLDQFDELQPPRKSAAWSAIDTLVANHAIYIEAVQPIARTERAFDEVNQFWRFPTIDGLYARDYRTAIRNVHALVDIAKSVQQDSLEQEPFDFVFARPRYRGGDVHIAEPSHRGRLHYVRQELREKFGFGL